MQKNIRLSFMFILLILTGCASMNNQFECPMKYGVMCHSLDEVNAMVDEKGLGSVPQLSTIKPVVVETQTQSIEVLGLSSVRGPIITQMVVIDEPPPYLYSTHVSRQPEKLLRIWIAPFEDTEGIYHEASHVWMVTNPSIWQSTVY